MPNVRFQAITLLAAKEHAASLVIFASQHRKAVNSKQW
jgi:hypothetical protein